jgi:DNA-binding cell septation regulator SpoVG
MSDDKPWIDVLRLRPVDGHGAWVATADVAIGPDMEIADVHLFVKGDQHWISGPSREYTTKAGERKFAPIVTFRGDLKEDIRDAIWGEYSRDLAPQEEAPVSQAAGGETEEELPF